MSNHDAADLSARLAGEAEAVCRHYLSAGRKSGRYWLVGDVRGTPGKSMFVRLVGPQSGPGAAGRWSDAATGEFGDLLDVIRESCGFSGFHDAAEEARRFLSLPDRGAEPVTPRTAPDRATSGSPKAARRLFAMACPIEGTLAEAYLQSRGITELHGTGGLRFHPGCYYRQDNRARRKLPAMVAAVTSLDGRITGVQRTWLARDGEGKAAIEEPRKAMGQLHGHGVRFGEATEVLAAGEGIETVLSVRMGLPHLPAVAALSASHLAALELPPGLTRLYVIIDSDPAGERAAARLTARATEAGLEARVLAPRLGDFNDDLRHCGVDALRVRLKGQLHPDDRARFSRGEGVGQTV